MRTQNGLYLCVIFVPPMTMALWQVSFGPLECRRGHGLGYAGIMPCFAAHIQCAYRRRRSDIQEGAVHVVLFAAFVMLIFQT